MALANLSDRVKSIIVLILDVLAIGLLGLADIYGWALPLWVTITDMLALVLLTVLGITWVVPKRSSQT